MIIFEGCDGAGKSTLAVEVARKFLTLRRLRRFECYGVLPPWWDYKWHYFRSIEKYAVVDRFIVSEYVYGRLLRGAVSDLLNDNTLWMIQEKMHQCGGLTVYVRPPMEMAMQRLQERGDELITLSQVPTIYKLYDEYLSSETGCKVTATPVLTVSGMDLVYDTQMVVDEYFRVLTRLELEREQNT